MYNIHHCSRSISSLSTTTTTTASESSSALSSSTPPSSPSSQRTSIPSTSSKSKATPATRQSLSASSIASSTSSSGSLNISSILHGNSIFAFNADDYTPSTIAKPVRPATPASKSEVINPMRVFYPVSDASPFCCCSTHALPDVTPAMRDAWGHEPLDSPRNSLMELMPDTDAPPPALYLSHPEWCNEPGLRIAPSPLNPTTLEKGKTFYATGKGVALSDGASEGGEAEDAGYDSMSTSDTSTLPTTVTEHGGLEKPGPSFPTFAQKKAEYLTTTMSMFGAPAEVQEAHWLYHQTFADKAQEPRAVLADLVERNLRRAAMVGHLKMKAALRQMTLMTFRDMFRVRSEIWTAIEYAAHPHQCSCGYYLTSLDLDGDGLAETLSYGHPARRLGAFAGALFALDVLSFADLRVCFDILRAKTKSPQSSGQGCVAVQALHAAILHAGDRVCKTKHREYMVDLAKEQRGRRIAPWIAQDRGAGDLLDVSMRLEKPIEYCH
ncbi:hypothetical protein SCHPADRAFT_96589 [Schizopora paradoxa]|uniref:Uncharacterized protein n=1 Tax=Schizopora paradoxa TaxID=27342 RepID=A0A0H2SB75_9AGAM|nr:hypothetical protein SCHPADRAFT_96589 [Schizopora paradoxa]